MDVFEALRELYQEKKRLDHVIATLESRERHSNGDEKTSARRGRKSMSADERRAVSRRMSLYWAARKAAKPELVGTDREESPSVATVSA